jgi:hypothetical protein
MTLISIKGLQMQAGETVPVEATHVSDHPSDSLRLDFWIETTRGQFESFKTVDVEPMEADEVRTITTEFIPNEEGL